MKFDRRKFFQGIAAGLTGSAIAETLPESHPVFTVPEPREIPMGEGRKVPEFPEMTFTGWIDRGLGSVYDTVRLPRGAYPTGHMKAFQIGLNRPDEFGRLKTKADTNMQSDGCFLAPRSMAVQRIGFILGLGCSPTDQLYRDGLSVEFRFCDKIYFEAPLRFNGEGYGFFDLPGKFIPSLAWFGVEFQPKNPERLQHDVEIVTVLSGWVDRAVQ